MRHTPSPKLSAHVLPLVLCLMHHDASCSGSPTDLHAFVTLPVLPSTNKSQVPEPKTLNKP